jgi:transposase
MSKSNHSEAQIICALKQADAGRTAYDVAREYGVSRHTVYAWKSKFGGMDASEAQKLRSFGRRERTAGAVGGRSEFGPRDAEGGDRKNGLSW